MQKTIIRKEDRGSADHGWLKPNHYFSFGSFHKPSQVHFGALRVVNDDFIAGGGAFPTHPHDNMEIITIPFTGSLQHKDSTGGQGIIKAGDVQIMSAGTGVQHSEANASATEPVTLFQIWIFPNKKNIAPAYDQRSFDVADFEKGWKVLVSPKAEHSALNIAQQACISRAVISPGQSISYDLHFENNGVFFIVIGGSCVLNDEVLNDRDSIGVSGDGSYSISAKIKTDILAIEVPMEW